MVGHVLGPSGTCMNGSPHALLSCSLLKTPDRWYVQSTSAMSNFSPDLTGVGYLTLSLQCVHSFDQHRLQLQIPTTYQEASGIVTA